MRASIAFFAGAGTVVAAIVVGVGGGLVMGDIMSPHPAKHQATRLEQRMSSQPLPPSNQPDQPQEAQAPVPYVAASLAASGATDAVAPAAPNPSPPQGQASQAQASHPAPQASSPTAPAQAADSQPQPSSPDNAYARARDADLKRVDDKRRAGRRQQWTARRQQNNQDQRDSDDQGWNDNRDSNRDWDDNRRWSDNRGWRDDRSGWRDGGSHEVIVRRADRDDSASRGFGQPMRFGFPGFNLFGPQD